MCSETVDNGFSFNVTALCDGSLALAPPGMVSARVTGTLTASAAGWFAFTATVAATNWVRLWIDDLRLVDAWGAGQPEDTPVTPALLPNVTLSPDRPVAVRVYLRPWSPVLTLTLAWRATEQSPYTPIPSSALSAATLPSQQQRLSLQTSLAQGWNTWFRQSNLAHVLLPHQVRDGQKETRVTPSGPQNFSLKILSFLSFLQLGVDLGLRDRRTGLEHRGALLQPQFPNKNGPAVPVRMGPHMYIPFCFLLFLLFFSLKNHGNHRDARQC